MWLLKKTKQTLTRNFQPHKQTPQFKLIDQLCATQGNVLSIPKLQQLSLETFDLQKCQMIFQILNNKLDRYTGNRSKISKLFKILVIIDYILLNGATAMIDLFKDNLDQIRRLSEGKEWKEEDCGLKEEQFRDMILIKSAHVVMILGDKQKRLQEKLRLNQAKLLLRGERMIQENNQNTSNIVGKQNDPEVEVVNDAPQTQTPSLFFKKRPPVFVKFQKFMSKKLMKLSSALLGLIDPDYQISDDYLKNKQFMEKGQSIIDEIEDKQKVQKQIEEENSKKLYEQVKKMEEQIKKNQNLLDLQYQFV